MQVTIGNFKAIEKDSTINTRTINIVTGQNSSGKSSFTQAIRLLKNNLKKGPDGKWETDSLRKLDLNAVDLGRFENVLNYRAKEPFFKYSIDIIDFNEFFFVENGEFSVSLKYKQGTQEEEAELASLNIVLRLKDSAVELINFDRLDDKDPKIDVNYDYLMPYFSSIAEKSKMARAFLDLSKKYDQGFYSVVTSYTKSEHSELINELQALFPEYPNIEEVAEVSGQSKYYQVRYEGGRVNFSILRPETETKFIEAKGFHTIGNYPLCEFLKDKADKPLRTLFEENKHSVPEIPREMLDLIFNMTRNEVLNLFRKREKAIVEQLFSKSFKHRSSMFNFSLSRLGPDIEMNDMLDEYIMGYFFKNNSHSDFFPVISPWDEEDPIFLFANYINQLISTVFSYISRELDLLDFFDGTNVEINRTYQFSSNSPTVTLLKQIRPWVTFGDNDTKIGFVVKWLKEFQLADQVAIVLNDWGDAFQLKIRKNNKWVNIATEGTGKAKLIFLILKIADSFHYDRAEAPDASIGILHKAPHGDPEAKMLILEEPEAFLHPNFQSRLAEMFMDAAGYSDSTDPSMLSYGSYTWFLIETHSEYLIRKFQYLVAKSSTPQAMADKIILYYLNNPNSIKKDEQQVRKLEIKTDGSLDGEFGKGFFDEASYWKIELMRMKHAQMN